MLPGIDGFEICRRIRMAKEIPILLVSVGKEDIDKINGLGLGAGCNGRFGHPYSAYPEASGKDRV